MRPKIPTAWNIHPFLRLTPPFLIGILTGTRFSEALGWAWSIMVLGLSMLLFWSLLHPHHRWAWKWMTGPAIFLLLIATGMACSGFQLLRNTGSIDPHASSRNGMVVELQDLMRTSRGGFRARAAPDLLIFIDSSGMAVEPMSGDLVAMHGDPHPIRDPGNPGEVDFASYRAGQGLYRQISVRGSEILILEHRGQPFWERHFQNKRRWVERQLHRYLPDSSAADLASTLITGQRHSMDGDLLQAYSNTGVVHVIAISGLHLALIHGILLWMMTPLFRGGKWSGMGAMVVLPCLWIYAFFTGASASVIRSAAMFTGIGMARAMDKRQFLLNGLASSALVLMAFRPDWISDIGCQLSYAALLSIAIFQPAIRDLMKVTNPLGVMVRDMVSVTLAAQVLTAPLVAWHFHRLPLLFLFSNIPVVPLSSLILLICLLICAFSGLSQIASPLGKLASLLIELMNGHVKAMDAVPYSSLTDLRLTTSQVVCLYAMIVLAWWGRIEKRRIGWLLAGACMLTCQIIGLFNDHKHELQQDIVVFNVRKQSLYAIVDGRNMLVLAGDQERADTLTRDKCIRQAVDHFQTRSPTMLRLSPGKSCHWTAGNARWEVTCGSGWTRITKGRDVFSVLVRSGSWGPEVRDRQPESVVVADASCPLWKIQQWKSTPDGVPSRFHSVPEQGAFISAMDKSRRPSH